MAITRVGGSWIHKYVSLVADDVTHAYTKAAKPELNLPNGSRCFEMDSDTEYIYDRENDAWEVYIPSSGGSGGTTNYNQLSNKPKINNVELSGNKTLAALGINAGAIGFDETETYSDGSVGKEVSDQKNAISQKQNAPSAAGTAGQVLGLNNSLQPVWVNQSGGGGVTDVKINGTSILSNDVANIPVASASEYGAIKVNQSYGIGTNGLNQLQIIGATAAQCKAGTAALFPVTALNAYAGAFYGLAKAAGDTTQSQSSNPVGTYTEDAKAAIRSMLGVTGAGGMNIVTLTGTQITQTGADNTFYVCGELTELTFTTPSVGIVMVRFTSGSTPTVCSFPSVTSWMGGFNPTTDIEANKTYDINVLNGIGVAGWA